jgi:predicted dithiol-disulfide oxidoreductase (DUF899 family)
MRDFIARVRGAMARRRAGFVSRIQPISGAAALRDTLVQAWFLDLAPLGRNEQTAADWWRRHDEYESE